MLFIRHVPIHAQLRRWTRLGRHKSGIGNCTANVLAETSAFNGPNWINMCLFDLLLWILCYFLNKLLKNVKQLSELRSSIHPKQLFILKTAVGTVALLEPGTGSWQTVWNVSVDFWSPRGVCTSNWLRVDTTNHRNKRQLGCFWKVWTEPLCTVNIWQSTNKPPANICQVSQKCLVSHFPQFRMWECAWVFARTWTHFKVPMFILFRSVYKNIYSVFFVFTKFVPKFQVYHTGVRCPPSPLWFLVQPGSRS